MTVYVIMILGDDVGGVAGGEPPPPPGGGGGGLVAIVRVNVVVWEFFFTIADTVTV